MKNGCALCFNQNVALNILYCPRDFDLTALLLVYTRLDNQELGQVQRRLRVGKGVNNSPDLRALGLCNLAPDAR